MKTGFIYDFLLMLARRSPMLLLAVGGIVFAIIRGRVHLRTSLMTIIALVIYLVEGFAFYFSLYSLSGWIYSSHLTPKAVDWIYFFVYFVEDFVPAVVIILLVAAALSQRNATTSIG